MLRHARLLYVLLVPAIACSEAGLDPNDPTAVTANVTLGQHAFEQSCAGCHASNDGFDLRTFGFTDTTIIRRASKHVDGATARNIVAYIHTLQAPQNAKSAGLFQPTGNAIAGDIEFAVALFGRDAWPDDMTTAQLASIDPRKIAVAIRMPVWADEESNLDWMPDAALPAGVLDHNGGMARAAIAGYHAAPTIENLTRAVNALKSADRSTSNAQAPCLLDDSVRVRYRECFEVRRWTSTLVAMHMLRNGISGDLGGKLHDVWWDVGNAARKSRSDKSVPIANVNQNWAAWMFLGWSFDPSLHSSSYTGGGFRQLNLMRHATFVALRSQVARPRNSVNVYEDLANAARFAPAAWTVSATSFALRHAQERLDAGERLATAEQLAMAVSDVNTALVEANRKIPASDKLKLQVLAQPVLAKLSQL